MREIKKVKMGRKSGRWVRRERGREGDRTMLTEVSGYPWVVGFQTMCVWSESSSLCMYIMFVTG